MSQDLGPIEIHPKSGQEEFHHDRKNLDFNPLAFWRWSTSNLVSNVTRGVLAEFIVAKAMGITSQSVRSEWDAFDIETDEGIKIEVKSAAYVQSWFQNELSKISFQVQKKRVWDAETNRREEEPKRPADIYVFALLAHKDKKTIDPLNLNQWRFYVLPTEVLNRRKRSQHSITLRSLEKLSGGSVNYDALNLSQESDCNWLRLHMSHPSALPATIEIAAGNQSTLKRTRRKPVQSVLTDFFLPDAGFNRWRDGSTISQEEHSGGS